MPPASRPNECWSMDSKQDALESGRSFRHVWHSSCEQSLGRLMACRGTVAAHHGSRDLPMPVAASVSSLQWLLARLHPRHHLTALRQPCRFVTLPPVGIVRPGLGVPTGCGISGVGPRYPVTHARFFDIVAVGCLEGGAFMSSAFVANGMPRHE